MIIGRISKGDETIRFDSEIHCSKCGKKVPGGLKASKKYHETVQFEKDLEQFKEMYLCGICRDQSRVRKK